MVPKIVHQIVLGWTRHKFIQGCLDSFKQLEPEYKIRRWRNSDILKLIRQDYPFVLDAYENSSNYGEASDIARYCILHKYGGIYVDWDIRLNDVDGFKALLVNNPNGYFIEEKERETINIEHMVSIPENLLFIDMLRSIEEDHTAGANKGTILYTGPYKFAEVSRKYKLNIIPLKSCFQWGYMEVFNKDHRKGVIPNMPLIHYWLHTWMRE